MSNNPDNHFVVLVSFEDQINNIEISPRVWVVPFNKIEKFKRYYQTRKNVSRSAILKDGGEFESAWWLIEDIVNKT